MLSPTYNAFISVVTTISKENSLETVKLLLINLDGELSSRFTDYEIIVVRQPGSPSLRKGLEDLGQSVKKAVTVINLATEADPGAAVMAGLDRANGDYVVIFSPRLLDQTDLVSRLYERTQEGYDIVFLREPFRYIPKGRRFMYSAFYGILRVFSPLKLDMFERLDRIISRRALNWLLRMREGMRYMKALMSIIGFSSSYIEIPRSLKERSEPFTHQIKAALTTIVSFTSLLLRLLEVGMGGMVVFLGAVVANAIKVAYFGSDLFGNVQAQVPGWTFLIVLISTMFLFINTVLYLIAMYLVSMHHEIKKRPLYILENVERL